MFSKIQSLFNIKKSFIPSFSKKEETKQEKSDNINMMAELEAKSNINRIGIMKTNFELGLSADELEMRTQKDYLSKITLLKQF